MTAPRRRETPLIVLSPNSVRIAAGTPHGRVAGVLLKEREPIKTGLYRSPKLTKHTRERRMAVKVLSDVKDCLNSYG